MNRRELLTTAGATLSVLAGCAGTEKREQSTTKPTSTESRTSTTTSTTTSLKATSPKDGVMYSFSGIGKTKTQPFDPPPNGAIFDVSLESEHEVPVRLTVADSPLLLGTYISPADGEYISSLPSEPCRLYVEPLGYADVEWHIELHRLGSRSMKQLPLSVERSGYAVLGPYEFDGTYEATATTGSDAMSIYHYSKTADLDGETLHCEEGTSNHSAKFEYHQTGYLGVTCNSGWKLAVKEK